MKMELLLLSGKINICQDMNTISVYRAYQQRINEE